MSTDLTEITQSALALPDDDRARLAQELWESLRESARTPSADEVAATAEIAAVRDAELTAATVQPQTHEEAMRAARKAIQ